MQTLQERSLKAPLLLRSCARLLRLTPRATLTALSYLHEYNRSGQEAEAELLVSTCLFLAGKVEEVPLSNNQLLNVVAITARLFPEGYLEPPLSLSTSGGQTDTFISEDLLQNLKKSSVLVSQEYYAAKSELLVMEQKLLRIIRFNLNKVEQPMSYLFNILHTVGASSALIKSAVDMMNDIATLSTLLIDVQPLQLSVAVTYTSALLLGISHTLPRNCGHYKKAEMDQERSIETDWYEALGVAKSDIELLGHKILDIVQAAKSKMGLESTH